MIKLILNCSILFITFSILVTIFVVIKGPSVPDRVQALDLLGINIISGLAILSVFLRTTAFFEVILLIGILSFVGTIALSRFIERGVVIDKHSE
ncbi:MAG TPA: Na(+)/H(+) antiporter subunit F1 [Syntrophomonadaceae bacterium]|nr:Na(+)/H(+) antiporter subunit F1 [Syntrophomonadaceae bacterium]